MSAKTELEKTLYNILDQYDGFLNDLKPFVDLIPSIMERKKETELKLNIIKDAPEEKINELPPYIYSAELFDYSKVTSFLPQIPNISNEANNYLTSGSAGTISAYQELVYTTSTSDQSYLSWQRKSKIDLDNFVEEKAISQRIPAILDKININLGHQFLVTQREVQKARAMMNQANNPANSMRIVLNQVWGGLLNLTRQNQCRFPHKCLEMKSDQDRQFVAECLAKNDISKPILSKSLHEICDLFSELSDRHVSKNVLYENLPQLNNFYRRWIIVIAGVIDLIKV